MITIELGELALRQISHDDIEQIRQWRNSSEVSKHMEFRDYITPEMQESWYEKTCLKGCLYFIIVWQGEPVGLINLKDIDKVAGSAESGIFFGCSAVLNGYIPYLSTICLFEFGFKHLFLKNIYASIMDDNKRAIRFNKSLGFTPTEFVSEMGNRR